MSDPAVATVLPALDALPERIVFFDGVCVVCNASVDWLLRRDTSQRLHFAPLQGAAAAQVRAAFPARFSFDIDTIAYFDRSGGAPRLELRSRAILDILDAAEGPRAWRQVLRLVPAALLDLGYRPFAALRYRLFGKRETCRVPTPAERSRFLD